MSSISFDAPRLMEMQDFLKYIYTLARQNRDLKIDLDFVYRELERYKLPSIDLDEERKITKFANLFSKWKERNNSNGNYEKGLIVEHNLSMTHFLQFYSKEGPEDIKEDHSFIKLYVPLSSKNIYENVNLIFDYITSLNIKHYSKVADNARSDDVIIRLKPKDVEYVPKIVNFILSNPSIRNSYFYHV